MSRLTPNQKRLRYVRIGAVGLFGLAAFSQAKVQVLDRGQTMARARETQRLGMSAVDAAKRGVILSADGKPLAQDQDTALLTINFEKVPQTDAFFVDLGAATGIPATEFATLAASGLASREWKQPMTPEQAKNIREVKSKWRADGVSLKRTGLRAYPLGDAAYGIVGALRDNTPVSGLERSQNEVLAGSDGKMVGLTDRAGNILPTRLDDASIARKDGENIVLTIDSDLQTVAANAVKEAVEKNKADCGVAVVMDPKTGDVLAMANWPAMDPITLQGPKGIVSPDTNTNYMSRLEPGSMMKILTLAEALDKGVVGSTEHFHCAGSFQVDGKGKPIQCDSHHGNRAHGDLDPEEAIARSCNICAAQWALRVGYDDFVKYIENLGLLRKLDVGLPYEAKGQFNYNDPAKRLQLACVGFGQSITVPPLSLASAFTVLGNHGMRMEPRIIARIGGIETPRRQGGQALRSETADKVLTFMQSVVESDEGTGKDLRIPGYRLAGKTGTAQRIGRPGKGYVANFVGYVPAVDPKAQVLVMIDHPTGGSYYGATVAGPVFVKIARSIIRRYNIQPTETVAATQAGRTRLSGKPVAPKAPSAGAKPPSK